MSADDAPAADYVALLDSGIAHMKDGQKAKGERLIRAAFGGEQMRLRTMVDNLCAALEAAGVHPNTVLAIAQIDGTASDSSAHNDAGEGI